jgi:hypothetical protein
VKLQVDPGFACPKPLPCAILAGFWRTEIRIQELEQKIFRIENLTVIFNMVWQQWFMDSG